jgi:ferredoxin-thioredoxin reductase catalytic chain
MTALDKVKSRAEQDAQSCGIHLTLDQNLLNDLYSGLKENEERYGYPSCPCRIASGKFELDRDIICPCDYRDPDVEEYGTCYCSLYVNKDVYEGKKNAESIPERRPLDKQMKSLEYEETEQTTEPPKKTAPVTRKLYYCRQCGYLVFREDSPYLCPICKAKKEMFAELSPNISFVDI